MSSQGAATFAAEQLLELLLQLKKTTPAAAKKILNDQPPIAYALITLMVSMNAINVEVFHKVLADYSASSGTTVAGNNHAQQQPPATSPGVVAPAPAIPLHLQAQSQVQPPYRNATPPMLPPSSVYPNGTNPPPVYPPYGPPPQPIGAPGYASGYPPLPPPSQPGFPASYPQYGGLQPQATPTPPINSAVPPPALPEALANIPEDQKAIIMRVLSMTPEQINMLPPAERATYIQLRATLGVATS